MAPRSGAVVHERGGDELGRERHAPRRRRRSSAARTRSAVRSSARRRRRRGRDRARSRGWRRGRRARPGSRRSARAATASADAKTSAALSVAPSRRPPRSPIARPPTNSSSGARPSAAPVSSCRAAQAVADLAGGAVGAGRATCAADDDPRCDAGAQDARGGPDPRRAALPQRASASAAALTSLPTATLSICRPSRSAAGSASSSQPGTLGASRTRSVCDDARAHGADRHAAPPPVAVDQPPELAASQRTLDAPAAAPSAASVCEPLRVEDAPVRRPRWPSAIFVPPKSMPRTKSRRLPSGSGVRDH